MHCVVLSTQFSNFSLRCRWQVLPQSPKSRVSLFLSSPPAPKSSCRCLKSSLRRGHLPQHVKFPGWKMHARTYKQYVLRSYRTSTFQCYTFWRKSFHLTVRKGRRKRFEGFQIWYFYWSFSSDIMAAKFARPQSAIYVPASSIGGKKQNQNKKQQCE